MIPFGEIDFCHICGRTMRDKRDEGGEVRAVTVEVSPQLCKVCYGRRNKHREDWEAAMSEWVNDPDIWYARRKGKTFVKTRHWLAGEVTYLIEWENMSPSEIAEKFTRHGLPTPAGGWSPSKVLKLYGMSCNDRADYARELDRWDTLPRPEAEELALGYMPPPTPQWEVSERPAVA